MGIVITAVICLVMGGAGMLIYLSMFTKSDITFEAK